MAQHHDAREDEGHRVGLVFPGNIGGGAVDGLEEGGIVSDLGLGGDVDGGTALRFGEFKAEAGNFLGPFVGDELEALGNVGSLIVFDSSIEVFDIFPDHREINAASRKGGDDTGKLANQSDVGEGLEELPQGDVGAFAPVANRGFQRAFERELGGSQRFHGLPGHAGSDALLKDLLAGFGGFPGNLDPGGFDDALGGTHHFGADAISWNQGHGMLGGLLNGGATIQSFLLDGGVLL